MSNFDPSSNLSGGVMVDENDSIDQQGSTITAGFLNGLQEEQANLITLMGGEPTFGTNNQLAALFNAYVLGLIDGEIDANDPNPIINGDMQVAQYPTATLNNSAFQFGGCDRWAVKGNGTISAGTIQQAVTTLLGDGGFASQVAAITSSTAGGLTWRYRMESAEARRYKNVAAIIQQLIAYHDTGVNQNFTITINKANAQDNFSAVTLVGASAAPIVVPSGVPTPLSFTCAPADVSNGIEIQVSGNWAGAIAGKNYFITNCAFHLGTRIRSTFSHPTQAEVLYRCQRYMKPIGLGINGQPQTTSLASFAVAYVMRAAPTLTTLVNNASVVQGSTSVSATSSSLSPTSVGLNGGRINYSGFAGGLTTGSPLILTTDNVGYASAEL